MSKILDELITDRVPEDIAKDTDRAYISFADLNRVEEACGYLAGIFGVDLQRKIWKMEDFRTEKEMIRIRNNIETLRTAFFAKSSTPPVPAKITYESIYQANDIERILKDLGDIYDSMVSGRRRLSFRLGTKSFGNRR